MRSLGALILCLLPVFASAEIPWQAFQIKREFVRINQHVWGLNNPAMLASQIEAESGFVDGLTSSAGARGICQAMPATASLVERADSGLNGLTRYSVPYCLRFQAWLMKDEYSAYKPGRGPCTALLFAGGAYNGGRRMLDAEIAQCRADSECDPTRWFGHVSAKRTRSWAAFNESRPYVTRLYMREGAYADAGFGVAQCR